MISQRKFKILHLTTHLNVGGISSYLLMACSRFVRMGHEAAVLSSGGNLTEKFEAKGIRCFNFPIRTKNEFHPKLLFALPRIIRLVKEEKFDLLHAHTRVTQVLAGFVSRAAKIPFISTAHGYYRPRLSRRLFPSWGERVVAVSPLVAEELQKSHKLPKSKIRIVQNAVDVEDLEERFSQKEPSIARQSLGIPQDVKVVGSVSRLVRDKGHEYLVEAMKILKKKDPKLFLLIVKVMDARKRGLRN